MSTEPRKRRLADGPVWALAAGLAVVAIARWAPPAPSAAYGGLVSSVADSTIITSSAGNGEDLVTILDQRTETILVYRTSPRRTMELLQVAPASELFDRARAAGPSNRR